jgi:hypothetical protein
MLRKDARLLAAAATSAALLGVITTPALAAPAPEATVMAYLFESAGSPEWLGGQNAEYRQPQYVSGLTSAHPGWSVHLSDETVGAGLPKQEIRVAAEHDETSASAATSGFLSLTDQDPREVPFLVLKMGSSSVSCTIDGPVWRNGSSPTRLFVRQQAGELYEVDITQEAGTQGAAAADRGTRDGLLPTTVKATRIISIDQLAQYDHFARYQGREKSGAIGYELTITQTERDGAAKTYRVLAGVSAASC